MTLLFLWDWETDTRSGCQRVRCTSIFGCPGSDQRPPNILPTLVQVEGSKPCMHYRSLLIQLQYCQQNFCQKLRFQLSPDCVLPSEHRGNGGQTQAKWVKVSLTPIEQKRQMGEATTVIWWRYAFSRYSASPDLDTTQTIVVPTF